MPTILAHAVAASAVGTVVLPKNASTRLWALGVLSAIVPDLDVVAFLFGIPYAHPFGHRGFTHSLFFALLMALMVMLWERAALHSRDAIARGFAFVFIAGASHGFLDAMTNGGMGIALLWPIDEHRYFLPFAPIEVSPIGSAFFSHRGWITLKSELLWIGLPCAVVFVVFVLLRLWRTRLR